MSELDPERLRKTADVAQRLYELAAGRFNSLVDAILAEGASGTTSVRKLVDLTARAAMDCDYWDPVLQELHDRAVQNYPKAHLTAEQIQLFLTARQDDETSG